MIKEKNKTHKIRNKTQISIQTYRIDNVAIERVYQTSH